MRMVFLTAADSVHSYKWINFFARRGHRVHWISTVAPTGEILPNISFVAITSKIRLFAVVKAVMALRRLIKEKNPDVLHAHYAGTYGLIGALAGFQPFITTVWGSDVLFAGRSLVLGILVRYVLRRAQIITCDAQHLAKAMCSLGVNSTKVRLVFFGVDTDKFVPRDKEPAVSAAWGVTPDDFVVISLRNLEPVYDVETLIKAVPIVKKQKSSIKLVIAGDGTQKEYLRQLAKSLGVGNEINFIGRYDNSLLPSWLCSADAYVSTSLSDAGIAASTAEAMACGVPVIVTNSGENALWINDGVKGFLVPVKNPELLAERIIFLMNNRERAREIGCAGRSVIIERNDYNSEMLKMESIYNRLALLPRKSAATAGTTD